MDERLVAYLRGIGATPDMLHGWTVHTAQRGGVDVGFVITRWTEVHMVSIVGKRAISRRNVIEALRPILEQHGYATTRVPLAETDHRLRIALGFEHTWSDSNYSYWALTELPYQKHKEGATPCLLPS